MIQVNRLVKIYKLYDSPGGRIKEFVGLRGKKYHHEFYALKDVSFTVEKGQMIGIIGRNGSGKSTLLKIVSGVVTPTSGDVQIQGRVSSLLELGAGFNPEFTGRENVYMNGALMGYSKKDIDERFEDIVSFAEIGEYLDQPVKSYSSGMYVRLAFAVAVNVDPDILIVDEVLAVGDFIFQKKCFAKLNEFRESGKTIIFVSHDMDSVGNLCHQVVWIDRGQIVKVGSPKEIIEDYLAATFKTIHDSKGVSTVTPGVDKSLSEPVGLELIDDQYKSFGVFGAKLTGFSFEVNEKKHSGLIYGGDRVILTLESKAYMGIEKPIIGFQVSDKMGNVVFGINTDFIGKTLHRMDKGNHLSSFDFVWPHLRPGYYSISPAIADGARQDHVMHHWVHDVIVVQSVSRMKFPGVIGIPDVKVSFSVKRN